MKISNGDWAPCKKKQLNENGGLVIYLFGAPDEHFPTLQYEVTIFTNYKMEPTECLWNKENSN